MKTNDKIQKLIKENNRLISERDELIKKVLSEIDELIAKKGIIAEFEKACLEINQKRRADEASGEDER